MKEKLELIFEVGAEGGSLSAYRRKEENGTYSFFYGTNEMGLEDNDWGISTASHEVITDFNLLLISIRTRYPEIYNLHPVFVIADYFNIVLYDLRNRLKNNHFDYRGWAKVIYLENDLNEEIKYTDDRYDKIELYFRKTLNCLDLIDKNITDEETIEKELKDKFTILKILSDAQDEEIVIYDNYNYLSKLGIKELDYFYEILVKNNPEKRLPIMISIEKVTVEKLDKMDKIIVGLGEIHNNYNLFSKDDFLKTQVENNIINSLEDFSYLQIFYKNYSSGFNDNEKIKVNKTEAINNDLPFIGENALTNNKVDFMFYFEGSRQPKNKISITVLAHLWATNDETVINKFCGQNKWWSKANYLNIKNRLNIDTEVLERSYISDAIRFDDNKTNEELIKKEIQFFKPKIVICIGNKAKNLVGMNFYDFPVQFHHVKFPKYHSDNSIYQELNEILKTI